MSPLAVRRYRAERLLQAEFRQLQGRVIGIVAGRVGAAGGGLDEADLEACYALAWQGLYTVVLEGREVSNPTGWLILATHRRAIDEQRARRRAERGPPGESSQEPDLAGRLDDRDRLRELFEGLRVRLGAQERQAAVLCYLHGLTRSEAAARMGITERRMRRLMEGRPGRPGVSQKLGELAASIDEGRWCEQQGSLMRGLAFGILDRDGERYRLAVAHSSNCPACRSYVASLRGLASVLPPVFLPGGIEAALMSRVGEGAGAAAAHSGAAGSTAGAIGGAAGAGAGGAGGGWILAGGPLGAKFAAGCLLALGVGAGCVGIGGVVLHDGHHTAHHRSHVQAAVRGTGPSAGDDSVPAGATVAAQSPAAGSGAGGAASSTAVGSVGGGEQAAHEFGPEQGLAEGSAASRSPGGSSQRASAASAGSPRAGGRSSLAAAEAAAAAGQPPATSTAQPAPSGEAQPTQAAREFSPG